MAAGGGPRKLALTVVSHDARDERVVVTSHAAGEFDMQGLPDPLVLSAQPFRMNRTVAAATAVSNVLRPLLALAAVALLPLPADVARSLVLVAAVPSGFFGILFGISYRQDPGTLGSIVTSTTVASIITLPVVIAFLLPG